MGAACPRGECLPAGGGTMRGMSGEPKTVPTRWAAAVVCALVSAIGFIAPIAWSKAVEAAALEVQVKLWETAASKYEKAASKCEDVLRKDAR